MTKLTAVYPQLFVTDMTRAAAFYRDSLGFSVAFLAGEPPFYGQVVRDGVRLNLRHTDMHPLVDAPRDAEQLLSAYIVVDDVDALFRGWNNAQVPFQQRLEAKPWGTRDFVVRDPDGNLLLFADT